jgi:hypothetical protein
MTPWGRANFDPRLLFEKKKLGRHPPEHVSCKMSKL